MAGGAVIAPIDGRRARGLRARSAIIDAMLALIEEGDLRPTAARIAARAGVSLRSVFQHFADVEQVFAAAADRRIEYLRGIARPVAFEGPFEERLASFVAARTHLLEAMTPVRRAVLLVEPSSRELAVRLERGREVLRRQTRLVFAPELAALPAGEQRELAAALAVAASWSAWEQLRRHQRLAVRQARAVVERTLRALLAGPARSG